MKVCRALGGFYLSWQQQRARVIVMCVCNSSYPQLHISAFAVWARHVAGLGMVMSPTRPTLGNHLQHLCFASIVQFECYCVLGFFLLLTIPTTMPAAPSPVRLNDLLFTCPEIHLGFCHVKLKDTHYFKLISANLGFVYLHLVGFYQ